MIDLVEILCVIIRCDVYTAKWGTGGGVNSNINGLSTKLSQTPGKSVKKLL